MTTVKADGGVLVREGPILMNGSSVRSILDGSKTQTRRVIKRECDPSPGYDWKRCLCREIDSRDTPCDVCTARFGESPYGGEGDRLYVKETWQAHPRFIQTKPRDIPEGEPITYRATYEYDGPPGCWRPSIFMPRWMSRITLNVLEVRVERVRAITVGDVIAEGLDVPSVGYADDGVRAILQFAALWDDLNGRRPGCSWGDNPFVWAITFDVRP